MMIELLLFYPLRCGTRDHAICSEILVPKIKMMDRERTTAFNRSIGKLVNKMKEVVKK